MVRKKEVLKRLCRNQRCIDYLYRINLPLLILDKIVEDGNLCYCRQCNKFSTCRCDYDVLPQVYTKKSGKKEAGWQKILPFCFLLDNEKNIPGWKFAQRAEWLAKRRMKVCFECEKNNCWEHVSAQKKARNLVYSNSRNKSLKTVRRFEDTLDFDDGNELPDGT